MTAQAPERIILEGHPYWLHAQPLSRLEKWCRTRFGHPDAWSTANYRRYIGTWEVRDGRFYLAHLCWDQARRPDNEIPISAECRQKLFRAASCTSFPIHATWYSGILRIPLGRRLIYSHHGWSSWYERERVIRVAGGEVVRSREVDTRAILEWWLRRNPDAVRLYGRENTDPLRPLIWFDDDPEDNSVADWPPDYVRPG